MNTCQINAMEIKPADVKRNSQRSSAPFDTVSVLGVPVARLSVDDLIRFIVGRASDDSGPTLVCYLNAHTANLAYGDPAFLELLCRAQIVYADGMAVVREAERLGRPLPERVNAGDFLPRFLWTAEEAGLRLGFVGSEQDVVRRCAETVENDIQGLKLEVVHHGHFERGGAEEEDLLTEIRECGIDVLLVGMGSPRQEEWAETVLRKGGVKVVWCVGALFEYYSVRRRAPVWMREAGLEWLFRLMLEPRRLAARYLPGNLRFLIRARTSRR